MNALRVGRFCCLRGSPASPPRSELQVFLGSVTGAIFIRYLGGRKEELREES